MISLNKFLYKLFLNNSYIQSFLFDLDKFFFQKKNCLKESILITGLARSGTTILLNSVHNNGIYSSFTYENLPIIMAPNINKFFFNQETIEYSERAHKDGIFINNKSPEEIDEYFWINMTESEFVKESYLSIHAPSSNDINAYKQFINQFLVSISKNKLIVKNNNSILRLKGLLKHRVFNKVIFCFRNPLKQSLSLLRMHKKFSNITEYELTFMRWLGHYEFGSNHKPFKLTESQNPFSINSINYWLWLWKEYYSYFLDHYSLEQNIFPISHEDICLNEGYVKKINDKLNLNLNYNLFHEKKHNNISYKSLNTKLVADCNEIHRELRKKSYEMFE